MKFLRKFQSYFLEISFPKINLVFWKKRLINSSNNWMISENPSSLLGKVLSILNLIIPFEVNFNSNFFIIFQLLAFSVFLQNFDTFFLTCKNLPQNIFLSGVRGREGRKFEV